MNTIKTARLILETSFDACDETCADHEFYELKGLMQHIIDQLKSEETDFNIDDLACGEVRVIKQDEIAVIYKEQQKNDEYVLGCTHTHIIELITGWPEEMVTACKEAEAFEALGKGILATEGALDKLVEWVERNTSDWGEEFNNYNGQQHEAAEYFIFRTN